RTGIDADHAQPVAVTGAAESARECHQRRVAGTAADVAGIEPLAAITENIDDHAVAARFHQRVERARHIDVAKYFEIPGVAPAPLVDLVEPAARYRAGIIDQDVDAAAAAR